MINNVTHLDQKTHESARRLISCADLQAIRIAKFSLDTALPEGSSSAEVELSTSGKIDGAVNAGQMVLTFDLRVRGKSESAVVINIAGRIEARYELPLDENPSEDQIRAFAKTNGMLNVWPYWRELVQSSTLRAGLPPLTLPLFRVIYGSTRPK